MELCVVVWSCGVMWSCVELCGVVRSFVECFVEKSVKI